MYIAKRILLSGFVLLFVIKYAQGQDTNKRLALETSINSGRNKVTLKKALSQIENEYNISLLFSNSLVNNKRVLKRDFRGNFKKELKNILNPFHLAFKKLNKRSYAIIPRILKTKSTFKVAPQDSIKGRVVDSKSGKALPGVNILVQGTSKGTATKLNGRYSLDVPSQADSLIFSYIGYQTQIIPIQGRSTINVKLVSQTLGGEEVVVVGYGTQKKSDLTGAISSINADEVESAQINSIDQGLSGRAAGVQVTQSSGQPGAVAMVKIRGSNSLQAGNQPLYVIDGLPIYPGSGTGPGNKLSALSSLNPQDIESIEILKDASATSIYGSRGSNGVVLITTKSGRQRDQITFSSTYGYSDLVKKINVMNAYEYAKLVNEAYTNDGMNPYYNSSEMNRIQQEGGTDWQDKTYRSAPTQTYNLNVSGGDQKTSYSLSGNYQDQKGIINNSSFKRYNTRLTLQRDVSDNLTVRSNLTFNKTFSALSFTGGSGNSDITYAALRMNPVQPVYQDKNANPPSYTLINAPGIKALNPVASANELADNFESNDMLGNIYGQYDILPNLSIKSEIGFNLTYNKRDTFTPDYIQQGLSGNSASIHQDRNNMWINENTIRYNTTINGIHNFNFLGGITFQKNTWEGATAASEKFVNNKLKYYALGGGTVYDQPSSGHTEWAINSYLGRIRYNYNDLYLVTLNGRVDGSSRFGENNKYGFFPSGAIAWRLINEDFVKDLGIFSNLKLRASYGITGNQEFGLYQSLSTLSSASFAIGRTSHTGFYPDKIPNKDLKWEKTKELDIGLDMGFWNNRVTLTSDYYHKKTEDLIYSAGIPWVSGFSTSLQNVGSIQNQGLELGLQTDNIRGEFNWNSSFNITFTSNKVLNLGGEEYKNVGAGSGHLKVYNPHRLQVGQPISVFYGYVFDGIFKSQQELDAGPEGPTNWVGGRRYKDISGPDGTPDGSIDATYDKTIIGNPNPDFYGGFKNTFMYNGFQLDVYMSFTYGNDIMNYNRFDMELPTGGQNQYAYMKNHWSQQNSDENVLPKPTTNRSQVFSSRQIEDGSYLKIQNITMGYNFPNLVNRSNAVSSLRLYLSMTNYFTLTNYSGYDPDISFRGVSNLGIGEDYNQYPKTKSIQIGLSIGI